jgi:hypothetical protein
MTEGSRGPGSPEQTMNNWIGGQICPATWMEAVGVAGARSFAPPEGED